MTVAPNPLRSKEIFDTLELLTLYDTASMGKIRVGPNCDGGYIMLDDLGNVGAVYSFGIGTQVEFDRVVADMGHPVFMYDHTIAGLPSEHAGFNFHQLGISARDSEADRLFTLRHHIAAAGHEGRSDLLLKMEVEGAEYGAIIAAPRETRQIVVEIHWLRRLNEPSFRASFIKAIDKLNKDFVIVHVHANNCAPIDVVDGYVVADVLELTYVRADLIVKTASKTVYPTKLGAANAQWASDHMLWFYFFLPLNKDVKCRSMVSSLDSSDRTLDQYRMSLLMSR